MYSTLGSLMTAYNLYHDLRILSNGVYKIRLVNLDNLKE